MSRKPHLTPISPQAPKEIKVKQKEGFTLFELLIAIFIGTILIMSGAYAIRVGLFSLGREEVWFNDSTKEKAAFDFFWQQTSSLRIQKIPSKDDLLTEGDKKTKKKKEPLYFIGEKDFLTFVSPLSFVKHYSQGLVVANYKVRLNDNSLWDLIYSEVRVSPTALLKLSDETVSRLSAEKDSTIFIKDCNAISFSYLDTVEEESDVEEGADTEKKTGDKGLAQSKLQDADVIEDTNLKWKEKTTEKVPRAIKLLVSKKGKDQVLISSIMAMYSFSASGQ